MFANPPFILLNKVLTKIKEERPSITLITPVWKQAWYTKLMRLSTSYVDLGPAQTAFTAHHDEARKTIFGNPGWTFRAWRID